jgi:ankyrin repeat protein
MNSMKTVTAIMLALLIITACSNKQNSSASQTTVKPPAMDIHTAAFMGNARAVKQHITAGTDLNRKDEYGSTPLHTAIVFGRTEAALALIEGGADLNVTNNDGSTPLHNAAFFCRTEVVESLLAHNADKSIRNNYGSTALESVAGPFDEVRPIYEQLNRDLGSLGLRLDYARLEKTRPVIAEMLQDENIITKE